MFLSATGGQTPSLDCLPFLSLERRFESHAFILCRCWVCSICVFPPKLYTVEAEETHVEGTEEGVFCFLLRAL